MIATLALRQALFSALNAHPGLANALGGAKVYDEPPRTIAFPYVTMGDASATDWSTGSSTGIEHALTLHIWSREGGQKQAHLIAGEMLQAMEAVNLTVPGHRLVNLRFATADIRREKDGATWHGIVRFRAVTEPA
jgi:hypothetical protein